MSNSRDHLKRGVLLWNEYFRIWITFDRYFRFEQQRYFRFLVIYKRIWRHILQLASKLSEKELRTSAKLCHGWRIDGVDQPALRFGQGELCMRPVGRHARQSSETAAEKNANIVKSCKCTIRDNLRAWKGILIITIPFRRDIVKCGLLYLHTILQCRLFWPRLFVVFSVLLCVFVGGIFT